MKKIIILLMFVLLSSVCLAYTDDDGNGTVVNTAGYSNGWFTLITGTVYDVNYDPIGEGVTVKVYCNDILYYTTETEADGTFTIFKASTYCAAGNEAYVEALYQNNVFPSDVFLIHNRNGCINSGTGNVLNFSVPEFNMATMSIAILGSVLGLVFIRRRK